jgi:choline dehydrogenase-like flavoprotein
MGPGGRVSHLETSDAQGHSERVTARFYVLACGGIETPRLLLHSSSRSASNGIGNTHGLVGRYFMEHLAVEVGHFSLPSAVPCAGRGSGISWQFSTEFRSRGLGNAVFEFALSPDSTVHVSAVFGMRPLPINRVTLSATEGDSHGDPCADVILAIGESERQAWEHVRTIGRRVASALRARSVEWSGWNFRWTHHHMGTCRMGTNPETNVCDENLRVHDVDNLYVSGSAPFVTCGASSPTLLLSALTLRLADHLATRLNAAGRG